MYKFFKLLNGDVLLTGTEAIPDGAKVTVVKLYLPEIFSTASAFAAVKGDGSAVTWGAEDWGGNMGAVREQLAADVQHINSTDRAFAAVRGDGSVVTWGNASYGGNMDAAREQLKM